MKSFKQILFQHSTTAVEAAILGNAKTVGVYRSWRPFKKEKNKNLSEVPQLMVGLIELNLYMAI